MKKLVPYIGFICLLLGLNSCANDSSSSDVNSSPPTTSPGPNDGKGGSLAVFALKNNYLYTVDNRSLHVFHISDPTNPIKVNDVTIGFDIETLFSLDNLLFMGAQSGMYIYDITNPENPTFLSESTHFTACDPVVANQTHAFVTLHSSSACGNNINRLMVYDIADLQYPELIHERNLVRPKGLALYEDYLIVCDDELKIFDITNPAEPTLIRAFNRDYTDVVIYQDKMYAFGPRQISQYTWSGEDFEELELISTLSY